MGAVESAGEIGLKIGEAKATIEQQKERIAFLEKQNKQLIEVLTKVPQLSLADVMAVFSLLNSQEEQIEHDSAAPYKSRWMARLDELREEQRATREKRKPEQP